MTMFLAPYTAIADIDGSPLDAGFLFFGEYGKDPELFPVEVFWDADFTVPAAQPIRTRNGYPVRNGSPTKVYLKTAQHSIVIKNRNSAFILVDFENKGWDASFVIDASGKTQQELNTNQQTINSSAKSVNALVAGLKLDGTDETTAVTTILNSGKIIEVPKNKTLTVDASVFALKQDRYWGEGFVKVVNSTDLSYLKPQPLAPYPMGYRSGYFENITAGGNKSTAVGHGVIVNRVGYPEISGYSNSAAMASYGSGDVVGSYVDVRAPIASTLTGTTYTATTVVSNDLTTATNIEVGDTIRTAVDSTQSNAVWLGWVTAIDYTTKTVTVDGWYKRYTTTSGTPTNGVNVITPDVTAVFGQNIVVFGKNNDSAEIFRGSEVGILIDTGKIPRLVEGILMLNMNSSVVGDSCFAAGGAWKVGYRVDNSIVGFQHVGSRTVDGYTGLVHQSVFGRKSNILKGMSNDGVTTFFTMDMYGKQSHERVIATTLTGGDKTLSWVDGSFYIVDSSTTRNITINPNAVYSIGTIWEFIATGSQTVTITAGSVTVILNESGKGANRTRIYYDGSFRVLELNRTTGLNDYASTFSAVQTFSTGVKVGTASYLNGTGSPEGVVTAPVGSLYTRTDGGAGTTLYVKESGTGNTGWIAK
ncbi:hypothetical protein [Acinetobacter junii]|uniref:hypothetical protein n=1 Tax=Acinetobacter junii TaxID=40215 RepID=UPI0030B29054